MQQDGVLLARANRDICKGFKSMATTKTTDSEFSAHVLQSDTPVLVDFWAEWCGPCKAIGPALEEISEARSDAISIVKLNIDEKRF